jgi:hypothetical protein
MSFWPITSYLEACTNQRNCFLVSVWIMRRLIFAKRITCSSINIIKNVSYTLVNQINVYSHTPPTTMGAHGELEGGSGNSFVQGVFNDTLDGSGHNSNNPTP